MNNRALPPMRGGGKYEADAMLVIFDVVGTLFSLKQVKAALREQDLPGSTQDLWFARTLMTAMAGTLAGQYVPLGEAAEASLRQVAAKKGKEDEAELEPVMEALGKLEPWEDAEACLAALKKRGHRIAALSNGSQAHMAKLLERAGLRKYFVDLISADAARAVKPHPAPYRLALGRLEARPEEACLVAAHGWDVVGADAVGMRTVWVDRVEQAWPFPGEPPDARVATLKEVPKAVGRMKPAATAPRRKPAAAARVSR